MPTVALTKAQEPRTPGEGEATPRKRVNYLQRALVLSLHELDPKTSHKKLADTVGISESSVERILRMQVTNVKQTVQALMQTGMLDQLDNWHRAARVAAKKGYHQPAKDFIEAAGGIDAKPTSSVTVDARPTFVLNVPYKLGALQHYQPEQPAIDAEHVKQPALPEPKP